MPGNSSFVSLLGAGASVEAGLLTSAKLTEKIYQDANNGLRQTPYARLLGYVISKLQVRNAKNGGSPYDSIEVEQLFDALALLANRDTLLVSEFVERWDSSIDKDLSKYDGRAIQNAFDKIVSQAISVARSNRRSSFSTFSSDYERLAISLQPTNAFKGSRSRFIDPNQSFLNLLYDNLVVDVEKVSYLSSLVSDPLLSLLATLNYDLSVEAACGLEQTKFDYGLGRWAIQKRVDWTMPSALRYLKLHGSINWHGDIEDPVVKDDDNTYAAKRALIFGGTENKLSSRGPFLQFLNKFERALLQSKILLVVGYSFRDTHINSIIKRWQLTRRDTQMVVVDPSPPNLHQLGYADGEFKRTVGLKEIKYKSHIKVIKTIASVGIKTFVDNKGIGLWPQTEINELFTRS